MSPQNLTQSADLSKLNIKGTQDDTPVSHADVITPDPPASPAKVSRERDEDPSDEPVAKRAKTESQTDTAEDSIGVAQVLSPAPVNSTDSPADEIPDDKRITQYQSKELRAKIGNIKKTKSGMNFRQSVEKLWPGIWPNYKALVDSPVDLTLFEAKLREDRYSNYGEFKADVRLLYENALKFNGADHIVTRAAGQVREKILVELPAIAKMGEPTKSDKNKSQTTRHAEPRSTHHARNQSHSQPRPAAAAPKPKPEPAAATPVGPPTPASSTAPAFALPPNGVPQIRRDSTRDDGDRPKRPIHPPKSRDLDYHKKGNRKKLEPEMKFFKEVLTEVTKGKYWTCNQWFTYPVDPVALNIPTYFNVIKKPMDLQTMADKLENGEYRNAKDLEKDMRQIVTNSVTFNGENDVTRAARELEKLFNDKLSDKDAWMARNYPSAPAPAASPDPSAHDSEEESEADEEEEDNEQIRSIVARMGEEQGKLSTLLGSKKPDLMMIEIQQNVVNMLQRKLVEEKSKFAETKKPKTKKKTPKTKPKPSAGAGPAASGSKKSTGGSTANKKALPTNKKPAPKKRTIGPLEKAVIAEGINELDGPMINKAVEIIKRDTNQKEDDDGQLELDIELLSHDALSKLYDLIMKAYPSIYASVSQRLEYNKQEEPAQQSKPKNGSSAAAAGSTASKPKKNKPMNKHEQERNIEKLRELKAQFQRQGSGSQEPQPGDGDQTRTGESSEEESDSEEE
ncbi:Bromodomain-containing protein [Pseudomassariella vexata]|uniref:Bromodomain-containing protein n=1 Tax=Pseudomassariella vexata TaxID=1141098 RepID=A0A1Y2DXJ0_9PEZI|nr:Bromodomain-containing protein [Pseudomassariella vexata]ORY63929.1 Bromodomain-containing protein [Pseudomassariella vexata]